MCSNFFLKKRVTALKINNNKKLTEMEEGFEILPPFFFRSIVEQDHDDERLKHNGLEYTPHKKEIK